MILTVFAFIGILSLAGSVLGCLYLLAATLSVDHFFSRDVPAAQKVPVTILKPLCGDDHELYANLRTFCQQDYPTYQVVFGIQNSNDPALPIIKRIISEFPAIDIAVVLDSSRLSHNMKVANLQNMLSAAKYDYLVMADSDMRVRPDYLTVVTAPLADVSIGAVTCLYRGVSEGGFWSDAGCMHVNYDFLPQAMLGEFLGVGSGCFGATIAVRRETLEELGGLASIGNVLADDHALGLSIRKQGKKVVLSPYVIDNMIKEPNLPSLFAHETRWARTVRIVHFSGYIGSFLTHPIALALAGLVLSPWSHTACLVLTTAIFTRLLTSFIISRYLGLPTRLLWLLPLRDMLSFVIYLNGFFCRTVKWRSHTFRVASGGQITLDGDIAA